MSFLRATPLAAMSQKRQVELAEAGRLVPNSTFARSSASKSKAAPTRNTGPDEDTLVVLLARSMRDGQPCCERCGEPLYGGRGWDWSVQHRCPRAMGGTRRAFVNSPGALGLLCGNATTPGSCHEHVESRRAEAREEGWLVAMNIDPLTVPVLIDRGSRYVYFGIDGEYYDQPPVGVA